MFKTIILCLTLILGCNSNAFCQDAGNKWMSKSQLSKLNFVDGFLDGVIFTCNNIDAHIENNTFTQASEQVKEWNLKFCNKFYNTTYGQIVSMIDTFYLEPSNRHIPIRVILNISLMKLSGVEVESRLPYLRNFWKENPDKNKLELLSE